MEEVAVFDTLEGAGAVYADPTEGIIVVLVDDGAVLLDDAQHGSDVIGEVVIEGGRAIDGLGEADPSIHAGQEPVDTGAVHGTVIIGVLIFGADVRAVVDVAGDLGRAPDGLAGQDTPARVIVVVSAGGSGGAVPVPAREPVASVVAEVLDAALDAAADEASALVADVAGGEAAVVIQHEFNCTTTGFYGMAQDAGEVGSETGEREAGLERGAVGAEYRKGDGVEAGIGIDAVNSASPRQESIKRLPLAFKLTSKRLERY